MNAPLDPLAAVARHSCRGSAGRPQWRDDAADSPPTQLPAGARLTQPWANGQGITTPVTCGPVAGQDSEPRWCINIARIPGDCDFSEMVGIDRLFMPLDDVPLSLDLDGERTAAALEVIGFAGEMAPRCSAAGPTRALNLMLRRGRVVGTLALLEIDGVVHLPVPQGSTVVVVKLNGDPRWPGGVDLQPGDALRQDAGSVPSQLTLDGRGRVAVISVR